MKTIKTICAACIGLFAFVSVSFSQRDNDFSKDIVGIWQLTRADYATTSGVVFLKEYYENGHFKNIAGSGKETMITAFGTYKLINDTTFVETIEKSIFVNELQESVIVFRFNDNKSLVYQKFSTRQGNKGKEMWTRIILPAKKQERIDNLFD